MHITIPQRNHIPETDLFVKILKQNEGSIWDRDVMVLIHGGPGGNHTLYDNIAEDLLQLADLIIIDLRGCGLSSKSKVQYCNLENHIDDLSQLLKILKVTKPIIHGCSYGAIVALGYSIKYSNGLSKLILSSGTASGGFIESARQNLERVGTPQQIEAAKKLWSGTFESADDLSAYYKIMAPLYIYNHDQIKDTPAGKDKIPYNIELVNYAFTTFLPIFDFRGKLGEVRANTLLFSGNKDWIIDSEQARILHEGVKNSRLINLDNCSHFPWLDCRGEFLSQMHTFVNNNYAY